MLRRYLVDPVEMWWPSIVAQVSLFRSVSLPQMSFLYFSLIICANFVLLLFQLPYFVESSVIYFYVLCKNFNLCVFSCFVLLSFLLFSFMICAELLIYMFTSASHYRVCCGFL